jgi:16S rRNA G966 N2-methylase RsmD
MNKTIKIECRGAGEAEIAALIPFQGELKTLSDKNYEKLKKQILELGFSEPFSVWLDVETGKARILNGHQRLATLKRMATEGFNIPLLPINHVNAKDAKEAKKKILSLTSQFGEMSANSLSDFMKEADLPFDFVEENFRFAEVDNEDLKKFFEIEVEPAEQEDDEPAELPEEPITKMGDVWTMGKHRLMCGDSTSIDAVEKLIAGNKIETVYTDPPYGLDVVRRGSFGDGKKHGKMVAAHAVYRDVIGDENTDTAKEAYQIIMTLNPESIVIWGANYFDFLPSSRCWIVWDKENGDTTFADGELAYTNADKNLKIIKHQWRGMIKASERGEKRVHPTQKPSQLAIETFEHIGAGSTVLDLFGGSGSTLTACEKTGRTAYLMELDPRYCDVIVARWEKFTGKKATRQEIPGEP